MLPISSNTDPLRKLPPAGGFTLFEVIIAAALIGLVGSIAGILFNVTARSTSSSTTAANTLAAVDSDLSRVKQLAEKLTCCPDSCTTDDAIVSAGITNGYCDNSNIIGQSDYYFPLIKAGTNGTSALDKFINACNATTAANDTITLTLITAINSLPLPNGITSRTAAVDDPISAHRVVVSYTGTTGKQGSFVNRTIKIVPTVATFCP